MSKLKYLIPVILSIILGTTMDAQETFRRGLESYSFIPKGQWITGVSVNYSHSTEKEYQFLVIEGINGNDYSFKVTPMLLYSFRNNLAAGGKFAYSRQRTKLGTVNVIIDSETEVNIDNLYSISHNFYGTAVFRNYMSMGHSMRFGFFNEVQLEYGGGESILSDGNGESYTGTFERNYSFDIGIAPGVIMFLNNYSAIELNIGVLGFSYSHTKSTTDQIYVADRKSKSANFRINLFSITFGVSFYL